MIERYANELESMQIRPQRFIFRSNFRLRLNGSPKFPNTLFLFRCLKTVRLMKIVVSPTVCVLSASQKHLTRTRQSDCDVFILLLFRFGVWKNSILPNKKCDVNIKVWIKFFSARVSRFIPNCRVI